MKDRIITILFLIAVVLNPLSAGDWYDDNSYQDRLLYLHAFVNYGFNPYWQFNWERNYFSGHGFLLGVGSVTTHDLLVDGKLVINQDLGAGWRFRGEGDWLEAYHLKSDHETTYMGFEKRIWRNHALYMLVNPAYDKEYTNLNMGILLADSTYENYCRLGLVWEDFVYDSKNAFDGKTEQEPLSLQWRVRYQNHNIGLYSEGRLSQGYKRRLSNPERSPEIYQHNLKKNNVLLKFYYFPTDVSILAASIYYNYFNELKSFYEDENSYDYTNRFFDYALDYVLMISEVDVIRAQVHYLMQEAKSDGYRAHRYDRKDFYSAFSYERIFSRHRVELQYMVAFPKWDYRGIGELYTDNQYVDKVKIGWTYAFPQGAQFLISVSHEVQSGNFGGGNLQTIILF